MVCLVVSFLVIFICTVFIMGTCIDVGCRMRAVSGSTVVGVVCRVFSANIAVGFV